MNVSGFMKVPRGRCSIVLVIPIVGLSSAIVVRRNAIYVNIINGGEGSKQQTTKLMFLELNQIVMRKIRSECKILKMFRVLNGPYTLRLHQ